MSSKTKPAKKSQQEYKELEPLYKMIHKYSLRTEAYKSLLNFYIKFQAKKK